MDDEEIFRHSLPTSEVVSRYATLDIETSAVDPSDGQVVAIGIGTYDSIQQKQSTDVLTYGGAMGCEQALIRRTYDRINEFDPDALVTFNGNWFDLPFLGGRIDRLAFEERPSLECEDHHIDLFLPRKQRAERAGKKWPALEEVLGAHSLTIPVTKWRGRELTNSVFGESVAPEYLDAVHQREQSRVDELESVIFEYTITDVLANIALYEADAGRHYQPIPPV